jgi:putative nucleotidyltransferase with HDIG domain
MSDVVRYLTSLAQALAKMSLYAEGHPARTQAAESSYRELRMLQQVEARPAFSFLGNEVIFANRAVRDLQQWDWANKLSSVGVQRIEFDDDVDADDYRAFLEEVLQRISVHGTLSGNLTRRTVPEGHAPIRFGAIGVRGLSGEQGHYLAESRGGLQSALDLSEEADAVQWVHDEVVAAHGLPLTEAEAIIHSLSGAMHSGHRAFLPLLTLKEFDQYTTTHALNVAVLAMALAEHLGLSSREARAYGMTGLLHDLGKVNVPIELLHKPGALTPDELQIMRRHPVDGARLILEADKTLDICAVVAFEHHIMIDGSGYPIRQQRCECHHASLVVHVCDVFDALRTHRPYRVAWETARILEYIDSRIGTEFDADAARAFLAMMRERELNLARAESIDGALDGTVHA